LKSGPALDDLVAVIIETCRAGLEPDALRAAVLPRLRKAVPVDAVWWATVDPATLLYTHAYREELPSDTGPYFVENEFLRNDVNKWTELAHDRSGVRTLATATDGMLARSPRYRDIFEPLGLGDELRAVFSARGAVWGFMCLHRERGAVFSPQEQGFIHRIAPHLAEGVRLGLLVQCAARDDLVESPGLILLAPNNSVAGRNPAADQWLAELGGEEAGVEATVEARSGAGRRAFQRLGGGQEREVAVEGAAGPAQMREAEPVDVLVAVVVAAAVGVGKVGPFPRHGLIRECVLGK